MASGGAEEEDGGIPLDIDNVHMLLQVEHEQIQKRTFTNWINAQLAKRSPPSYVSDLFSDLRDGSQLLDLLEIMSSQPMKRQRGRGVFQQRANIETALNFLKKKSIKLVNINISNIIDGRPSIILGLIWTIILHCHIEELANTLSFSSCHSSLESLASLDSWSGSPVPASPVPGGRTSPLHRRFRISAKKALLMWVRDQCQKVGCSVSMKDFKVSWRSGEAFLAILCSLRPQLVDLSLTQSRSNQENLEEAFHLAEKELHIPRLLEPQDVDVKNPDEKSIMTYVAQFLQYSNDMPSPDDHLQVSPSERALEVTSWLQQAYQELSEAWTATEKANFAEKYQVLQNFADSFTEQRRPVMTLLAAIRRCPELSQEQCALRTAWDRLEEELQRCKADLDSSLPPPLDSVVVWLQRAEATLAEERGRVTDHADAAKEARAQQDTLKDLIKDMSHHINVLDTYSNIDDYGNLIVPLEKFDEIKRRLTNIRVIAKYQGIKLEYQESRHTVLDLLNRICAKVQNWKAPYKSQETVCLLLQDWQETVERQGLLLILMDALQNLKEKANTYNSKASLGEDSQRVARQVKEAESEAELVTQAATAARGTMERVVSAWETYNDCIASLQTWLVQKLHSQAQSAAVGTQEMSEWTSCQAKLNEAGNLLIEVTESLTSITLVEQLSKVNMQWAECMKRTMFEVSREPSVRPLCLQMVHSLTQETSQLLRQPLEVASAPLKANRQKLQQLSGKMAGVDLSSISPPPDSQTSHIENLQRTLPQMLAEAERTCGELQQAASMLEGRLAELDHWSTEALDCYQQLKEKKHKGRSALDHTAKALVSRGLQLQNQVVMEGQDLLDRVARAQKISPLQYLSTSGMQDRMSEAVSHCQEILEMFSSLGFCQHVETAHQTQRQPEDGSFVVARTKHVDQIGNIIPLNQDPNQISAMKPRQTPLQRTRGPQGWDKTHMKTQDGSTIVVPYVQIQTLPQPSREPVSHVHSSLAQTVKEAESEPKIKSFSQSHAQLSSPKQSGQRLPALLQVLVGAKSPQSPILSKVPVPEEQESSYPSQPHISKSTRRGQPNNQQSNQSSLQPPVVVRSEVHSKAQSMARSRLEKARFRLQGRIQQAIKLFGGKEMSESEAKRKQRALKILQPAILEEFLDAVECLEAFCTGPQLQDLMLLSESVRKQWEDVRQEMSAFVPVLWSKIRAGKQPFSVVQCEKQTNTLHEATDQTDGDSWPQQQDIIHRAASADERVESLRELCETLTPRQSSCLATDQLRESDEAQEIQPSDTELPSDCRERQLRGNTPLRATGVPSDTQQSSSLPQKHSVDSPQRDLSLVGNAVPLHPHDATLQLQVQDIPAQSKDDIVQDKVRGSGKNLKSSLKAKEQPLKARLLHVAESKQQAQTHIQAVVRGNTMETKQEAEWTVISETAATPQEELPSMQEVLERYTKSSLAFQSQLHKNKQHLELISEPTPISTLQNQKKQLQTSKQDTEALWFEFELQYAQLSQFSHVMTTDDKSVIERDQEQLTQEWRRQQMCLQNRMTSLQNTADLMESADNQIALITEKLGRILRESVDISSFSLADPRLISDLKDMGDRLQSEMRTLPNSVHHLEQLRQRLEKVQSAAQALDHFLATVRELKAEIPTLLANQDPSRQQTEAGWEQERCSWQAAMQQKLQTAAEQSDGVDSSLKAAGMTLSMEGAVVTCQDVMTSLSQQAADVEKELMRARKRERKDELLSLRKEQIQENEELNPTEMHETKTGDDSLQQARAQEQELLAPSSIEESEFKAKRSWLEGDNDEQEQREEEYKAQTWKSEGDVLKAKDEKRRQSSQVKTEGGEKESLVQGRAALIGALREIRRAAEQLGLQEPTLPALQQRTRALTELESGLAGHLAELQNIQEATSQSGFPDVSQTREVEDVCEETTKAVTERLEQCNVLTELLKRFQSIRGELSGTLQRAENTISEQASYMGKDNLQRLHTKVQETKAELSGLGSRVEEVRSVCRQLHTHLRQVPECTNIPFEAEADALMDRWLDISERTDSHLENLQLGLTMWDGVLQLGEEVESWTTSKLAVFAQSLSFQTEENISALQKEIVAQEENMENFHSRTTEIQELLQSTEPPLELQVVETQKRKKIKQLKELVSEAEDVHRQMVAAKGQITARMSECFDSLQKIQDSLINLSGSDVAAVLAKLKDLLFKLQKEDEQAESLLEDLRVMASIASPVSLQSVSADGMQLRDKVRNTHQLFSEVEEQTERNIHAFDRLQRESEHLEHWLQAAEERAAKEEDLSLLQEEALHQRGRTEALSQLVSSLQSSTLKQSPLVAESSKVLERYRNLQTNTLCDSMEKQGSLSLSESTHSWIGDLKQTFDSPLGENLSIQRPAEQRFHRAPALVSATTERETRLEELSLTEDSSSQKTEEQWRDQPVQPHHSALRADPELTSYLCQREQACRRVEELRDRTARLPTSFPWPGVAERRQIRLLAHQLQDETESLRLSLAGLAEQRRVVAEQTSDDSDPSSAELESRCSTLIAELKGACSRLEEGVSNEEHFGQLLQVCHHKLTSLQERMSACQAQKGSSAGLITDVAVLEAFLREVTDIEKDLLQIVALKDSIEASSTAEAQASLSQQVGNLQNHKRALDGNIRESLALLTETSDQRIQQVKEEVSCVQSALKGLTENVGTLCGNREMLPDVKQLKTQWHMIQDCDTRLTELVARVCELQKTGELSTTQETLPAGVILTLDAVAKDLDSLTSMFVQKKQECAENTTNTVRQLISQLQRWSQRAQDESLSPSQAALDEGLWLQQALRGFLSERDFLLNCLGTEVTKTLEKSATDALTESTPALESLSKCLVSQVSRGREEELDQCLFSRVEEPFRSEIDPPQSALPSFTATDYRKNSESDQNDNNITTKSPLKTAKESAFVPDQISCAEIPHGLKSGAQLESQQLISAPLKINLKTHLKPKDDTCTLNTDTNPLNRTLSGNNSEPLTSLNKGLIARRENPEPVQEGTTSTQDLVSTKEINKALCVTSQVVSQATKPDKSPTPTPGNVSEHLAAQSNTSKPFTDVQEQETQCKDINVTPKKVVSIVLDIESQYMQDNENVGPEAFRWSQRAELCDAELTHVSCVGFPEKKSGFLKTIISPESGETDTKSLNPAAQKCCEDGGMSSNEVLDIELPEFQPQDLQKRENVGGSCPNVLKCSQGAELCDAKFTDISSVRSPEKKSGLCTPLISPESDETHVKVHSSKTVLNSSQDTLPENPSASVSTQLEDVKSTSAKLSCKGNSETHELMHNEVLNSSDSCGSVAECQLTGAHAAETVSPKVIQEEMTDFCQAELQTMRPVLCTVEEDALTETQTPAGVKQPTAADTAQSTSTGQSEATEGREASVLEHPKAKLPDMPKRRVKATPLIEDSEWTQDTQVTQEQIQEDMEPERTAPGLVADLQAGETAGGSSEPHKHRSTMEDILSDIQGFVEKSNIINRTPHTGLNWYLQSSPGEAEIRLVRTIQKVLACRYQLAQLDVSAMSKQLQDAEDYRRSVQEQVVSMKNLSAARICDPDALKRVEAQWSAALLDASATVQVKAAQLDQVKQYHKQMKITRAFLEVLAAEKDKMSLNALGSSALQADKLQALLQTMVQKKDMMEKLLQLSSQLSGHLSDAESSGALLAQLGDVQEEWRLLEGSIKRALQHASSSASQSSLLIKEAEQLKAKLEALQTSIPQSHDSKSDLEVVCLTTDLKLYSQIYQHLQSQSDALVHFSLGQKEKEEIKRNLQQLGSLLKVTKSKLDSSACSFASISSAKINKQLQDLIMWAKQAENHISIGKKLALFPEEARIQIVEMKKFQTDIWYRRSQMQVEVEHMKGIASGMEKEESDQVIRTTEDLYGAIADSLDHVLDTMRKNLQEREKLLCQLASMDVWLAEMHAKRDPCAHVDNVSKADIRKLVSKLKSHKLATLEIESQLKQVEAMEDSCREISVGLSPGEGRYLVNRLSGLWTELDGLLAHEKATSWELEELIHEQTSSDEELSTIQASLQQISTDLQQQKFPLTQKSLSTIVQLKHMLMEHQCQVQELRHCQEAKRRSLLCTIGELQDLSKALSVYVFEQDKYLHLRRQMEKSRDISKEQIQRSKDTTISLGERFRLCQTLLVELPLVKTQCQEAADQLEAIAQELYPSELNSERQRIQSTVETLVSWEHSVTDSIKSLEAKLLLGLRFSSELPALMDFFQKTRVELEGALPMNPDENIIDIALRRCWVIWRNMESGMRVLEGLGRREKINLKIYKELYSLRDATMQEWHFRMGSLSQARESLKDYQWAAQGAISFLHNAEATFLSAPGGFVDCTEEQRQTRQALEVLEDGFQAHIHHLVELVPQQPCLSRPKMEQLHISILSQLLVGRAILEAQAQLRLESLQRCEITQQSHRKCHEDIRQRLSGLEAKLSQCAAEQVTSYDKCVAQQKRAKLLMEDLRSLAGKTEELRAGCPMQGCGVGKDGELGALWRRWVSLRRGIGLLVAHTEQRAEEWKDITSSMEQCCSFLASLQADVPDSYTMTFTHKEPQELLIQAEMHQAGLDQEQQALASLEHRLEHALSLSGSQDPISPGPIGKTLVKIQENVRSLKERNLQVVAAAQAEEKERQQIQQEIGEVEQQVLTILPLLEACSNPCKQQELRKDLSSQRAKLNCILDRVESRYTDIPADISARLQEVQLSLQREEEKLMEGSPVRKLAGQVVELGSGLENIKRLLEQRSPTVSEARTALKHVWDELDTWHSRLMLLESEVQDLAEEHPNQAHLLMDQLTRPLQLYQSAAQMAEQRTAFLSKIPACLQEFEDIVYGATCWVDEAQSWLSAPCSFTTARSLQNHANSLQLVLDDSERIRHALHEFRPVLDEICSVCDISTHEQNLDQKDQQVQKMQHRILEPLEQLLQAVEVVEAIEAELKTMEKNIPKIRAILSSMDNSNITLMEHLNNRQVILANVQSMQRTLEEMERCKGELHLPEGAEESLVVVSRAKLLLQPLEELEQLTKQQATLLENKIREEDLGVTTVSEEMEPLGRSPQRHLVQQEAFEVSNSEEEEAEEDESYHSSSSDTLTCSIPEDPEETLNASDVQTEDIAEIKSLSDVKVPESSDGQSSSEVETSSKCSETGILSVKPELDTKECGTERADSRLITMDSEADVCKGFGAETEPTQSLIAAAESVIPATATPDQHGSTRHDPLTNPYTKSLQAAAAVEDTRLVPERPTTPFTTRRASDGLIEEANTTLSLFTALHHSLDTPNVSQEQSEVSIDHSGLVEKSKQAQESSEVQISLAGREEDDEEKQRWSQLYTQTSQKLTTLKKVQEEHETLISSEEGGTHEKVPEREPVSTGSVSAVLQLTQESITMLRLTVSSADGSHPGVNEELYTAVRRVLLSLDALTDLLLTPAGAGEEEKQLRLLQQECVSMELVTLAELLSKVESETRPDFSRKDPEALRCLTSLQDCLHTAKLVCASSHNRITEHLGITHQHQELSSNQLCILDEFELVQDEMFSNIKDAPSLECVLGRHLRESPGEKAKLQQASWSLLQGITRLLDLGEECVTEGQTSQVHNRSQLQAVLCRHKKLLQVLSSQLAFVQRLFQREPEALGCQEAERVQLEVRAKALQQQALKQEVTSQRRIQEWTRWEGNCGRLGSLLDDLEVFISSGELGGEDEKLAQHRQDACQQALVQLDESRAVLGLLLDQGKLLQTEPEFAATVGHAGGALELRWHSASRRMEQEVQRCRDIQSSRIRFQTDFASVSEWLLGADKHLRAWSNLADTADLNQECINNNLIKLLDFSMETEAMSVQRASVSREVTHLLHLKEADCPGLRAQLDQLEVSWSQLTSDLSKIQDRLQQRLLAVWPPKTLLSDLEGWLKKMEARLSQEKESALKTKDAAQITETLKNYQGLKAGMVSGQVLLDFLCQSGPQVVGGDVQALRSERTMFAEKLAALRLQWLNLQRELESQICEAEQIRHTCADRERRLQRLRSWIEQQKKQLNQLKQPTGQTLSRKALLEMEAIGCKVGEVAAALQKLKATRVHVDKEEDHPCDIAFSVQTENVCHACGDLSQEIEALRPALQQTVEEWSVFERDLREVSLHTTRVRCALQHEPLFSLKHAEEHMDLLQQLEVKIREGEELWASVEKSYQSLVKTLHYRTAQALDDEMEGERKRWKDVVLELTEEHVKTGETLSLWQEYTRLSDQCSLHLQRLWHQWEELLRSYPQQDTQAVQRSQDAAEDLQSSVGDVLAASKPLNGQLEPLVVNLIQSETRLLSRDVLLLSQAMSGKKKSLQEDLEQQRRFHARLETLEEQMHNMQHKLKASLNDTDSVQLVLSQLSDLFSSLVDVRAMSAHMSLTKHEMERLHMLSRQWADGMAHMSSRNRELQAEHQHSQSFQERCKHLGSIQRRLEEESVSKKPQSYSTLQEMLTVHQRLEVEMNVGHQLLQGLLHHTVESVEKLTGEERSELVAQTTCMRESWFNSVALAQQRRSLTNEQLAQWRVYHRGMKLLWKLLRDVDPLLPPAGPALCTLHRPRSCTDDYQKWSQCQDGITSITSELEEMRTVLKQPLSEDEKHMQETELSLQRLASGLKELVTMKTDLSQYVAAGDSALLEQQLEQLHGQWEELCMKVSLRRQEIADRLNAWTIFNDKNKEFCDWLTQMENKVCHNGDLSIEEMVEKLKKDCMEEINLFSESKSHLKQLGEQLLLASDEAKQTQVHGSLQEVNQRWHHLFHHIEARVKKLKETLVTVQQLDKNMSNLRSWLSRMEAELSRPITYSVCHHQEIQRRLAEQQELQRDIEQHTAGVASVLNLCDVLLRDEDAGGGPETESDSLQETSRSLDQRWRTICAMALDRRLRIEETWRLWCKFLDDYSRFEDWLKMAERTAANPNSADVLYTVAKEELKKFEGFQRQVHERLTQLELVNNQYRRLARENRTDRASQLKAMVHEGNRRWDTLHRRVAAVIRRLKYFTSQREEFEGTRESMLVWLTELDLQLTNVEHFSESDVHHKIQQLNSFQKEITLNTERIDGLIVFGEGLIQKSSPQDAALIEDELEELHSYCQEVFSRLVRFHQRLSQPPMIKEEAELSSTTFSLESSLELIGRPWLGRSQVSLPTTPTHLLASPLERSGRETPVSVDSLPLEWDHTGDVGGSSSHEDDDEEEEEEEEERIYFSALSDVELTENQEEFVEAPEALRASSLASSRSLSVHESPRWRSQGDTETQSLQLDSEGHTEAPPTLTSTPLKRGYLRLMSQCSGSIEDIKRVSLILDDEEQPEELGLTGLTASDKQSGVIERWELLQARSRSDQHAGPQEPQHLTADLDDITSWLEKVIPELERLQQSDPAASIEDMATRAKELKETQKTFTRYKSIMLSVNLRAQEDPELQERLTGMNRAWSRACTGLQQWDTGLRRTLMRCQEFHETLHSLLLWLAHAESRRYAVDISNPETPVRALQQHRNMLTDLQQELQGRRTQQASLQALWSQLQPEDEAEESVEAQEKLHVTGSKLKFLLRQVDQDLSTLQQRLDSESASEISEQGASADPSQEATNSKKDSSAQREKRDSSPPRPFFYRVLRAAFPLHLLLLFLLLLPCLIPVSESDPGCTGANNFARSFYPMLHYTNGPPPT